MRFTLYFIIINLLFISCDSSLDINADYKNIPVVYSLLDKNDSIQYIKLNKAFLGDASVSEMAKISDSLNYDNAIVNLIKYKDYKIVNTFSFERTDTIKKDEGFFADDNNIIYIYKGNIINKKDNGSDAERPSEFNFVLDIKIPGIDKVSSQTKTVSDVRILAPLGISYRKEIITYSNKYVNPEYKYKSGKDAKYFEYFIEISYYENINGAYRLRTISHKEGINSSPTSDGDYTFSFLLNGKSFYQTIANNITNSSSERIFYSIRYKFMSAGEDLTMYIDLTKPTYGIVQEKPAFTNITNGWGLFSSRTSTYSPYKILNISSLNHLAVGEITKEFDFKNYSDTYIFYSNNRDLDIYKLYITP